MILHLPAQEVGHSLAISSDLLVRKAPLRSGSVSKERSEVTKLSKFLATLVATIAVLGFINEHAVAGCKPQPKSPGCQSPKPAVKFGAGAGAKAAKQVAVTAAKAKRQANARSKHR